MPRYLLLGALWDEAWNQVVQSAIGLGSMLLQHGELRLAQQSFEAAKEAFILQLSDVSFRSVCGVLLYL